MSIRKNNKGFTMIEILAAIIIMGVLLMIAVPSVSKLMKGFRNDYYDKLEKTINASAKEFYTDNKLYRPTGLLESSYTSIESLINKKYVENLVDYKGKNCSLDKNKSYVIVIYRGNGKYEYKACLQCPNDDYSSDQNKTYCDPAWLTNDNIKYDFGIKEQETLYIYYNTPKDEVREKLLKKLSVVKYNSTGEELDRVALAEASKENILPENIDELDTTPALDKDNKKETILKYNIQNELKELTAIVYKHKAPKVSIKNTKDNSTYRTNTWSNGLVITLSTNDNFFETTNTSVAKFQMRVDDGTWTPIDCKIENGSCQFYVRDNVQSKYYFRILTNEGKISDETDGYLIQVDVTPPKVNIDPNGKEIIVVNGGSGQNVEFTLTPTDEGGSGIASKKYAISNSNTTAPTSFNDFTTTSLNVKQRYSNAAGIHYVWAKVVDRAGNESIDCYPSNAFRFKYEVKYNVNGGSGSISTQYKTFDSNLTLTSSKPTRTGYKFKGWATSSSSSTVSYSSGATYTENKPITLYAVWEANKIYVRYNMNGGTLNTTNSAISTRENYVTLNGSINYSTYNYGDYLGSDGLANYNNSGYINIVKTGYSAKSRAEWKKSNGTTFDQVTNYKANQLCDASNGDCIAELLVNWQINSYTVSFNANGGSVSTSSTSANYGSSITLPTPTRSGYKFNGWYTAASGGVHKGGAGSSYRVESNITLYAQWTANTPTVPAHTCTGKARSYNLSSVTKQYVLKYFGVNSYNHWCSSSKTTESCLPTNQDPILMYYVTCPICGKQTGGNWCPVHGAGGSATSGYGGKSLPICDAESKKYSSDATQCVGKDMGWTLVSK